MSLLHFLDKSKREIMLVLLIILFGVASFGLGRLSAQSTSLKHAIYSSPSGVVDGREVDNYINKSDSNANEIVKNSVVGAVIASKNGNKYHDPWCPGASKISEKNRIEFKSEAEAEGSGYSRAANCPK